MPKLPRSTSNHYLTIELRRAIQKTIEIVEKERKEHNDFAVAYGQLRTHIRDLIKGIA